jgi:glycine/D-amino acid oxidase-like deaminating enzyme
MHLVKAILSTGTVNLQTHTPAVSITTDPNGGFVIETPRGKIHTTQIVYANNAYVSGLLPEYEQSIIPCKGICCRITVPEGTTAPLLNNSYINRTNNNTLSYLIPRADGSIIVGGAAAEYKSHREQWYNNMDDSVLIDAAKDYYTDYMQRTFRGWENTGAKIDKIWTGIMGYTYDSNPHVGAVPNKPGQFILAGFNGHGMPVIWLSGKELAKMVAQEIAFEQTSLPRLFKTTQQRIDKAKSGSEEDGDILSPGVFAATKQ